MRGGGGREGEEQNSKAMKQYKETNTGNMTAVHTSFFLHLGSHRVQWVNV